MIWSKPRGGGSAVAFRAQRMPEGKISSAGRQVKLAAGPATPLTAPLGYTVPQLLAAARLAAVKVDGAGWAALAILLTLASVFFSLRATGSRT